MKPPIPLKNGAEYDCFYARGIYCYLKKAGVASSIKKYYNRRTRRTWKAKARINGDI